MEEKKLTIIRNKRFGAGKKTLSSDQRRGECSVRLWSVLDPSLGISAVLNDVFVSGLPG